MIEDKSSAAILDRLEACRALTIGAPGAISTDDHDAILHQLASRRLTMTIIEHDAILDRLDIALAVDREIRAECDSVLMDAMTEIRYLRDALVQHDLDPTGMVEIRYLRDTIDRRAHPAGAWCAHPADRDSPDSHELHVKVCQRMNALETRVKALEESYKVAEQRTGRGLGRSILEL